MEYIHLASQLPLLDFDHSCQVKFRNKLKLLLRWDISLFYMKSTSGIISNLPLKTSLSTLLDLLFMAFVMNFIRRWVHRGLTRFSFWHCSAFPRYIGCYCHLSRFRMYFSPFPSKSILQPKWVISYLWHSFRYLVTNLFGQYLDQALGRLVHFLFPNGGLKKRLMVGGLLLDSGGLGNDFKRNLLFLFFLLGDNRWFAHIILVDSLLRAFMFDLLIQAIKQILRVCFHFYYVL